MKKKAPHSHGMLLFFRQILSSSLRDFSGTYPADFHKWTETKYKHYMQRINPEKTNFTGTCAFVQ